MILLSLTILTRLSLLSLLPLSFCRTESDIRLYLPTSANLTRYQQGIFTLFSDPRTYQLGVLQIYLNGEWGSVCDDGWSSLESQVVCSQLNLSYTLSYSSLPILRTLQLHSSGNTPIWLDEVSCTGDEKLLVDCSSLPVGAHDCTHEEDINLMCSGVNLEGIYQGVIATIIILVILLFVTCVCCCCCCCPCCPIARYLRPNIGKDVSTAEVDSLIRSRESHLLEFQPFPTQQPNERHKQEIWTVQEISD